MNANGTMRLAGIFLLLGMIAGIFSVAPAVDSPEYLTEAAANSHRVLFAAVCQFLMMFAYLGFGVVFYSMIRRDHPILALGFLTLRVTASALVVFGTLILVSLLVLSREFTAAASGNTEAFSMLGAVLRESRDAINHVFMIIVLCTGNFLLYLALLRSKLIPAGLSVWGLAGSLLSIAASILVFYGRIEIISPGYLVLNAPTGLQEIVLGLWLIIKAKPSVSRDW